MADSNDSDFDTMMRKVGVKRLHPEGSADPGEPADRPRTVRRRAGEAKAPKPASAQSPAAPAAPAQPDRSAEIAALEARVSELESELTAEKEGRAADLEAAKSELKATEERFSAYADIAKQVVRSCINCPSAPGFPSIRVEGPECEVCGGTSLRATVRKFIDACLVNGRLKVCVAGNTSKAQALLRAAAQDRRVTLVQTAVGAEKSESQARGDVKHADAVVLWRADGLEDEILSIYRTAPRLVEVSGTTLTALIEAATEVVASD